MTVDVMPNSLQCMFHKCGFLLERKERSREHFSHTQLGASLRTSVWEFPRLHGWCKVQFLFRHLPLLDMPHPATCEIYFFECIKLKRNYSLATMLLC